jgi:hypothetical protein
MEMSKGWWYFLGGIGLGWLAIWSPSLNSTLLSAIIAASAAAGAYVVARAYVAAVAPDQADVAGLARIVFGIAVGVTLAQVMKDFRLMGETHPSAVQRQWRDTQLTSCQISRAVFAKAGFQVPGGVTACSDTVQAVSQPKQQPKPVPAVDTNAKPTSP